MRIIQQKRPFEDWTLEVTCTGKNWFQDGKTPCGSILEIDANDLTKRKWSKYLHSNGIDYGFTCPVCQCFTEIDKNIIPEHIKVMAKDYV